MPREARTIKSHATPLTPRYRLVTIPVVGYIARRTMSRNALRILLGAKKFICRFGKRCFRNGLKPQTLMR